MAEELTIKSRLQQAAKTEAEWLAENPVLKLGELAFSTDVNKIKVGDGGSAWTVLEYLAESPAWSQIANKPTTLAGYGITDAKIASGVITLGSNTITPLTKHQDISGKADKTQLTNGSVTKVGTATVGDTNHPIYLKSGVPTAVTSIGEAYLSWGGKDFTGSYGAIDAAMIGDLGANRLAFAKPAGVVVEYSRDGGETWVDYGVNDTLKTGLFSLKSGGGIRLGAATAAQQEDYIAHPTNYLLRVKLRTGAAGIYTTLNKLVFYVTTSGSSGCYVTLEVRTQQNYENDVDTWVKRIDRMALSGWSGYNVANIAATTTYGNNKASQYGEWMFTFGCTTYSPGTKADGSYNAYYGLQINSIFGFGGVGWSAPSTMAATNHLYAYDAGQNAVFPAKVTATALAISKGTSEQFLKADGSIDSSKYLTAHQSLAGYATQEWVNGRGFLTSHQDISGKADKATTLAGYGITDAKIASGVITLGGNNITPLTKHQDISGKVDKVSGKGLSTNDYTTAEKNKLAGIAAGATANQGTVTRIVAGSGLTGGTITGSGTIGLNIALPGVIGGLIPFAGYSEALTETVASYDTIGSDIYLEEAAKETIAIPIQIDNEGHPFIVIGPKTIDRLRELLGI